MQRIAALDLGTNTFLCLIAEGDKSGLKKILHDSAKVIRLGQDVNKNKFFHPDALNRADQCLREFKNIIDSFAVSKILAMATSAARDVKNQEQFFSICKKYNIPVKIISGDDEARITYCGATAKLGLQNSATEENCLVVDIGGGSTELILGKSQNILHAQSLNIGCVRLTEELVPQQPVTDQDHQFLADRIESELKPVLEKIRSHSVQKIIAVAGTPTALAASMLGHFEPESVDGFILKTEVLQSWVERLKATSVEEKISQFNIEAGRADVIYVGALILWSIARCLALPSVQVSIKGVRYGVALELLES